MTNLLAALTTAAVFGLATWMFFRRGYVYSAAALLFIGTLATLYAWQNA